MTRDETIELANKCGDYDNTPVITHGTAVFNIDELERFANAIERRTLERAAKVCEELICPIDDEWRSKRPDEAAETDACNGGKQACAAAIREMLP